MGSRPGKAPCHATYHYFFASLDADALSRVQAVTRLGRANRATWAIFGKTLRGSKRGERKAGRSLGFAVDIGAVIGDLAVEPDAE